MHMHTGNYFYWIVRFFGLLIDYLGQNIFNLYIKVPKKYPTALYGPKKKLFHFFCQIHTQEIASENTRYCKPFFGWMISCQCMNFDQYPSLDVSIISVLSINVGQFYIIAYKLSVLSIYEDI